MSLPTDAKARKDIPIYSGFVKYFPLAMAAVAELSRKGNEQHNPGKPLHWDRSKSGDELDALMRHLTDEAAGVSTDADGVAHLTKVAWRAMAQLQKMLEAAVVQPVDFETNDGWREHNGGPMPCAGERRVDVRFRNNYEWKGVRATEWSWDHFDSQVDIVAWRYASKAKL